MSKWLKRIGLVLLALILLLVVVFAVLYWTRFASIATVEEIVPDEFYTMDFKADYKLDELLSKNLENDDIFVDEAIKQMFPLLPIKMEAPDLLCTVFAAETADGQHVFGRNYDLTETNGLLLKTSPKDGYSSLSMVDMTIIDAKTPLDLMNKMKFLIAPYATIDGINEKGLGVAALVVNGEPTYQDTGKTPITTNLALRLMLDKAANVSEAVKLLEGYDMRASGGASFHFFITDTSGKSVVVEYYNNEMTVVDSNVCTNFFLTPGAPPSTSKNRCYERFDLAKTMLETAGKGLTAKSAMDILSAAHMDDQMDKDLITTQWSEVFNLETGAVTIALDRDYGKVYEYTLNTLK
ncbi:MAG: C45 family peptidase [Oscillospiraceae bacterium]